MVTQFLLYTQHIGLETRRLFSVPALRELSPVEDRDKVQHEMITCKSRNTYKVGETWERFTLLWESQGSILRKSNV